LDADGGCSGKVRSGPGAQWICAHFSSFHSPSSANLTPLRNPANRVPTLAGPAVHTSHSTRRVKPPNSRAIAKPNKTNLKSHRETRPALPVIVPPKRTMEETVQRRLSWKKTSEKSSRPPKNRCRRPRQNVAKSAQKRTKTAWQPSNKSNIINDIGAILNASRPPPPFRRKRGWKLAQPQRLQGQRPALYERSVPRGFDDAPNSIRLPPASFRTNSVIRTNPDSPRVQNRRENWPQTLANPSASLTGQNSPRIKIIFKINMDSLYVLLYATVLPVEYILGRTEVRK